MTNREWLQSLSDEELAEILTSISTSGNTHECCQYLYGREDCGINGCYKGREEWLQAEHKEIDNG